MFKPILLRPRLVLLAALPLLSLFARPLAADTTTIPVAASVSGVGGVPFVSDVRVFNTSYTDVLSVTAVYRFNGQTKVFQLSPREAQGFDDICVSLFSSPGTLGAVEFSVSGSSDELVVTSQLRSPVAGGGHVGMFVPGLPSSAAAVVSVLTSLVNGDSRTNIGVYNPNGVSVTAAIRVFDGGVLLGTQAVSLGPHAVTQVNNIYAVLGFGGLVRTDGYATVESSDAGSPLFTYAAEADNHTGDLILIVGAKDVPAPAGFNPARATLTPPSSGSTPTPTPTPAASNVRIVNVGASGTNAFRDTVSNNSTSTIRVGDTVQWKFASASEYHSTTSGTCTNDGDPYGGGYPSCNPDGNWDSGQLTSPATFSKTFSTPGDYRYYCSVHGYMMTGTVQVSP
jgi:plastocyanin